MTANRYGAWPYVIAFDNDAERHCVDCAREIYGKKKINDVVYGREGWQDHCDHSGNPFNVVFADSDEVRGEYCMDCHEPLWDQEAEEWFAEMVDTIEGSDEDLY